VFFLAVLHSNHNQLQHRKNFIQLY